jgi:hypothetical protein
MEYIPNPHLSATDEDKDSVHRYKLSKRPVTDAESKTITKMREPVYTAHWTDKISSPLELERYHDYGSSGNDCVYRALAVIANAREIRYSPEERVNSIWEYLFDADLQANNLLRIHFKVTMRVITEMYGLKDAEEDTIVYKWKEHLLKHNRCLDVLGLAILCSKYQIPIKLVVNNHVIEIGSIINICQTGLICKAVDKGNRTHFLTGDLHYVMNEATNDINMMKKNKAAYMHLLMKLMGAGNEEDSVLMHTNQVRESVDQDALTFNGQPCEFDSQGHDPGEYTQLHAMTMVTNEVRGLLGQMPLRQMGGESDQKMYEIDFHKEERSVFDVDLSHNTLADRLERFYSLFKANEEEDEHMLIKDLPFTNKAKSEVQSQAELPVAYLSHIEASKTRKETFLWDSGATHTIIGRGSMLDQITQKYEVLYHNGDKPHIHVNDLEKQRELEPGSIIKVMVASGNEVIGTQIDSVDIKVPATDVEMPEQGEAVTESVKLTLLNPILSRDILTDVISESHFLETNRDFTMITHGKQKYLLSGEVTILVKEKNGKATVKIPLRYEDRAHYLDPDAVVLH